MFPHAIQWRNQNGFKALYVECICICLCICVCICVCICTHIIKSMYVVIHACMSICTCACMYVDVFVCFCVHNHIFASMRARVSEHIHTRVYIYIWICLSKCMHTRTCELTLVHQKPERYKTYIEKLIPKGVNRYIVHVYPLCERTCVCI